MELYLGSKTGKLYIQFGYNDLIVLKDNMITKRNVDLETIEELSFYTRIEYLNGNNPMVAEWFWTKNKTGFIKSSNGFEVYNNTSFIERFERAMKNIEENIYVVNKWIYFYGKTFKTMNDYSFPNIMWLWWNNLELIINEIREEKKK